MAPSDYNLLSLTCINSAQKIQGQGITAGMDPGVQVPPYLQKSLKSGL
jgi:hypothetical protein